jgi:hypothetical protein
MDWSLLQPNAKKRFLRDVRGFKNPYWYYAAMAIDPILRFNWVFYVVYTHDLQHSTICSFLIALSEVTRRGMWTALRVENEHSANVALFKASRDVPLPYDLESRSRKSLAAEKHPVVSSTPTATPSLEHRSRTAALVRQASETSSIARRPARAFSTMLANAHTQDFEKKRKPGAEVDDGLNRRREDGSVQGGAGDSSDDDDDEDDKERDVEDVMEVEGLTRGRTGTSTEEPRGKR